MIKLQFSFPSQCLGREAEVRVLLPNPGSPVPPGGWPTLYLLHGLTDCADTWLSRTSLERYCDDHAMAVVLPTAQRSFYCDMTYGDAFFTHVAEEIPAVCESLLPLAREGAHRYIAGNSMGGYGAMKIALKHPGKFSKVATLSGALDINGMIRDFPEYQHDWLLCFGGSHAGAEEDVLELLPKTKILPQIYHYCGSDDFLAEGNHRFCKLCEQLHIPLTSTWEDAGVHGWPFWDPQIEKVLDWLET